MLKSYAVNNHSGGELETTFMREYQREVRLRSLVRTSFVVSQSEHVPEVYMADFGPVERTG